MKANLNSRLKRLPWLILTCLFPSLDNGASMELRGRDVCSSVSGAPVEHTYDPETVPGTVVVLGFLSLS